MSDLKFNFMGASIRKKGSCTISLKISGSDYKIAYMVVSGKRAVQLLKKKERINIGFTNDQSKIAFSPSETYGYKYMVYREDSVLRIKSSNDVVYDFAKKNQGEYNVRFTDDGIVYADVDADQQLMGKVIDNEADEDIEIPIKEDAGNAQKSEEPKRIETSIENDAASSGEKVFVTTFDCICRQCRQPIKVITRAGQKGKPVNPRLEFFAKSEFGTKTYVTAEGVTMKGIPYSKKTKGMQEGYQAHWETCASSNSGRK